jgi:hypothetical protein
VAAYGITNLAYCSLFRRRAAARRNFAIGVHVGPAVIGASSVRSPLALVLVAGASRDAMVEAPEALAAGSKMKPMVIIKHLPARSHRC